MKYQGKISDVKAIQKSIEGTRHYLMEKKVEAAGWEQDDKFGVKPTLYTRRLTLIDESCKNLFSRVVDGKIVYGFMFYISFKYMEREDKAELWIKDEDTGRLFKVFPELVSKWGTLTPIILNDYEAEASRESYRIRQELKRSEA